MNMGPDHETVIRLHTPERYILGELLPQEREEFEEHAADCNICMQELAAADLFAANASAVFADEARAGAKAKSGGWLDFFRAHAVPSLAFSGVLNVALLMVAGYGVVKLSSVPDVRPGVSEMFVVRPPARSGESQVCAVGKSRSFATLTFDLPHAYQRYSYSLEGVGRSSVDAHQAGGETLHLTVALAGLKPGDHKFQLTGWDGQQTAEIGECILRVPPNN
jgi:hypothetical protein